MANTNNVTEKAFQATVRSSLHELSKLQRVSIVTNSAQKLDDMVPDPGQGDFLLEGITNYAMVDIHNERSHDNKDYSRLVIFTEDGGAFYTGSPTFIDRFEAIMELMADETGWALACEKGASANYKGKNFLSCRVTAL